jgi:upstream activation factor subunit UAF30
MATTKKAGKKAATKSAARKAPAKSASKASARKSVAKGGARKGAAKKAAKKRAPNPAFMKPMQPSGDLAAVVGDKAMPRTEITKKVWAYIKKHNLQDAKERRMINADANLKKVFGGKNKVSMFEMTRYVNNHLG